MDRAGEGGENKGLYKLYLVSYIILYIVLFSLVLNY